jgi:hypothetical protein
MIDLSATDRKGLDPSADTVYAGQAFSESLPLFEPTPARPTDRAGHNTD